MRYNRIVTFLSSFFAFFTLIYGYGFELSEQRFHSAMFLLELTFVVFVLSYLVRLVYAFKKRDFLKNNWIEGVLMLLIVVQVVSHHIFDVPLITNIFRQLGFSNIKDLYHLFITLYMLLVLGVEVNRVNELFSKFKLKPSATFIVSFILIILVGTGLLMLPTATTHKGSMGFLDALFTSVSATCVTGLIVVDTATYFTFKGQIVILVLMQVGGIGIISFATFFATLFKGMGLKQQSFMQNIFGTESLLLAHGLLRRIIVMTLFIEMVLTFGIFISWSDYVVFDSLGDKIFYSIFHAVSAFCNAGFSLFSNGLFEEGIREAYLLHLVIALAIILGGIGFPVINDVLSIKRLRERLEHPWKDWSLSSKVSIYTSVFLIGLGMVGYYIFEKDNTMQDQPFFGAMITSFFQSVTTRTAGFNTIDFSQITIPAAMITIFLMFIGASPGSMGGGIKTTTFFIINYAALTILRGYKTVEVGRTTIPKELVYNAFSVFIFAAIFNFFAIFLLAVTEAGTPILSLVFEQISAFATVGLTTGITAELSVYGKIIIIVSMFIGRVGTLTLVLALSSRIKEYPHKYPDGRLMIG